MKTSRQTTAQADLFVTTLWAIFPIMIMIALDFTVGAPYNALVGLAIQGLLALAYSKIGGERKIRFDSVAPFVTMVLALPLAGWAS